MELGSVIQVLENKTILVTGATGFLAKIFVEKILRVQPNVKKLYLLVRAADAKSASQRLQNEVIAKDLYRVLREKLGANWNSFISEKVTSVPGDITLENLGVKDSNLVEEMWREVNIVVNVAATTNFDDRYDVSLSLNTMGAKHVFNFAKKCAKIMMLLHVSTAYVSGERAGLNLEKPFYMGETINGTLGLDIEMEKKIVAERLSELRGKETTEAEITLTMKDLGIESRARKYGWPNTYVFTKAMGEMLLGEMKENEMPIVILRPTIITSTYKEPFPGWIEGLRTVDSLIVGYGKGKLTFFPGDLECILDLIPADMVVNSMVVAMAAHANKPNCREMMIYQVGSSVSNPIKLEYIKDYSQSYFKKHPWIGRDGKPIKVGQVTLLTSMATFHKYMAIRYLLPLKGLRAVNTTFCHYFHGMYVDLHRKIKFVMRMIELYQPYLFFKGVYDDTNTEKLQMTVKESSVETKVFYFDPKIINWEDYFMNIHIPGVVKSMLM
ncbi:alcohol-forming fatty acyl-CoA reductase-like isoform X1 [Camellia sinensis]|uniref:alcohol-forming fatty acyl-CoA reductase-like isoform X1 n=1 Tax=Camellia sinensis TaxID=4442 RepID=UPI0010368F96|nr:alcohol-forming fatty acyl-CoA reductase-like isoform X1 [Camellia sinensis]